MNGITAIRTAVADPEHPRDVLVVRFRDARTGIEGSQAFDRPSDASKVMRHYAESGLMTDVRTSIENHNEYLVREGILTLWFRNDGTEIPMPVPVLNHVRTCASHPL